MDNANKIEQSLAHKEVALFLGDDLHIQGNEKLASYNLEDEYAKTKKNSSYKVWIVLTLCFVVVFASTAIVTKIVSNSNHKITINIDSFDDLNLRSLLNSVDRAESVHENALRQKKMLEQSLESELLQAQQKYNGDLFILKSITSVSSEQTLTEKKEKIDSDYAKRVADIHKMYDSQILEADEEIKRSESQLTKYDADNISRAKQAESSIDSDRQLHNMEMKFQADSYEQKISALRKQLVEQQLQAAKDQQAAVEQVRTIYQAKIDLLDPKAREQNTEQDKIILDVGIKNSVTNTEIWNSVENLDFRESDYTSSSNAPDEDFSASLKTVQKELAEMKTIAYRFKPIPMENSIKDYVPAIIHQSYTVADNIAQSGQKMQSKIDSLSDEVAMHNSFLEQTTVQSASDGVVLSSLSEGFKVYITKANRFRFENNASVDAAIMNGSKIIAEFTVTKNGDSYIAVQKLPAQDSKKKEVPYAVKIGDKLKIIIPDAKKK